MTRSPGQQHRQRRRALGLHPEYRASRYAYKLASFRTATATYVDGSPTVGDICLSTPCAGLERLAHDPGRRAERRRARLLRARRHQPASPRALWEFTQAERHGLLWRPRARGRRRPTTATWACRYGNPIITKLKATGRWVVIVTSGLNNTGRAATPTGRRRQGYLYILDA